MQPDNIDKAFLVWGGDHGQGAFRVVFRALLRTLTAGPILYNEKCIAEVYCAKEEGILLDESVMPWLETDLQKIKDSQLIATLTDGQINCSWEVKRPAESQVERPQDVVELPSPLLLQSADLAFDAYTLGKEGGAGHYCPYCKSTKAEWSLPPDEQPEIQLWTLEGLEEMYYDSTKKGAQKLGVKSLPKINSINVDDIVLPVTRIRFGIDNDIISAFEDKVEASIDHVPPEDAIRRRRLQALLLDIETK